MLNFKMPSGIQYYFSIRFIDTVLVKKKSHISRFCEKKAKKANSKFSILHKNSVKKTEQRETSLHFETKYSAFLC